MLERKHAALDTSEKNRPQEHCDVVVVIGPRAAAAGVTTPRAGSSSMSFAQAVGSVLGRTVKVLIGYPGYRDLPILVATICAVVIGEPLPPGDARSA